MAGIINGLLRTGLSMGLMDREAFVGNVSSFLEQYRDDPEQMRIVSEQLYNYLLDMKARMDMKSTIKSAVNSSDIPDKKDIEALTEAIRKLTEQISKQNK